MNTNELNYAMLKMMGKNDNKIFKGVFASNQIPITLRPPFGFIVNNQNSSQPGEHWVAFFKGHRDGPLIFFDSYGLEAETISKNFARFTDLETNLIQNETPLQNLNTDICGQYCLFFLYHCFNEVSFHEILNKFPVPNCSPLNDDVVCRFVANFEPFVSVKTDDGSIQCCCKKKLVFSCVRKQQAEREKRRN